MTPDGMAQAAADYLATQLPGRRYTAPQLAGTFSEQTLAGEGAVSVYTFELAPGPGCHDSAPAVHYVVVGETTPNFFPAYGLSPDDAFSLHIGTRFMLEMQIGRVEPQHEPREFRESMRTVVASVARGAAIEDEALAGLFQCDEQLFAVYRLMLGPAPAEGGAITRETVYFVGGDCPPGFYRLAEHPPQVALRLHLGKVIRAEPAERPGLH
jgi:hypothetical protein